MSSGTWRVLGTISIVLSMCALFASVWPWFGCSFSLAESVQTEPAAIDESPTAHRVRLLRAQYESASQPIPLSQLTRVKDAMGVCSPAEDMGVTGPALAIFLAMLGCGGLFRRRATIVELDEHQEREAARRAQRSPTLGVADSIPAIAPPTRRRSLVGDSHHTSQLEPIRTKSRPGETVSRRPSSPGDIGIDVDIPLEFGKRDDDIAEDESVMKFVEETREARETQREEMVVVASQVGGYYCPPAFRDKAVIYVDPASKLARDEWTEKSPLNEPEKPFKTLEGAVKYAQTRVLKDTPGIQIRLAPGIYKASVLVPDRVAIINHRMPAIGSRESEDEALTRHLKWITDQAHDAPDRVTILAPADAEYAVKFVGGTTQGIFGCHIMGNEGRAQAGIVASRCQRLHIRACVIDGFARGGVRLDQCGTDVPGQGTFIQSTELLNNAAAHGGGISAEKSVLNIVECLIHGNKAHRGAGICAQDMRGLLSIVRTRISKNTAAAKAPKEIPCDSLPSIWKDEDGLGGGACILNSKTRIAESEFVDNKATGAGGAVMILGGKAAFQGNEEVDVRMHRNAAPVGSALCVVGWQGSNAVAKYVGADIQQNRSSVGGTIALLGLVSVQFDDGKVAYNEAPDRKCIGAAFSVICGAELVLKDMEIKENQCGGPGGALGALNSTLRVGEGCEIRNNSSKDCGGGLYFVTRPDTALEELVAHHGLKMPFVLATRDCIFFNNSADDLGGGIFVGNHLPQATFPIGMRVEGTTKIRNNRTRHPNAHGDDVWVVWADEVVASSENRPPAKVLLK